MRLPAFPIPYEGETVSSVVARFLGRTAGPTRRKLAFLGLSRTASTALMPLDLRALTDAMPLGHPWCGNPERVLMQHTLVPLHVYFAHPQRAASSIESLLSGLCGNPAAALGLTVSTTKSLARRAKFCAQCVDVDIATRGNAVSYREHQPEFVKLCATHGTPLLLSCSNCLGERKTARMWQTAGSCDCNLPSFTPAIRLGEDAVGDAGWLWLSRQVKSIFSTFQLPTLPLLPVLRRSLQSGGYRSRSGISSPTVLEALESRFGRQLLGEVGALGSESRMLSTRWPSRLLGDSVLAEQRLPDVLRPLLLAALVASDVTDLLKAPDKFDSTIEAQPRGYSGEKRLDRARLSSDLVEQALASGSGKINVAASLLGVSAAVLAVDMRRLGVRLPLPSATVRRHGSEKVEAVRAALRSGEVKAKIKSRLRVSEWLIRLIELDDQDLAGQHRTATIEAQRIKHRETVAAYIAAYPSAGKTNVRHACVSATGWLAKFDSEWLAKNLPKRKTAAPRQRVPVREWGQIDESFSKEVGEVARSELAMSTTRPVRLTVSMLLKRSSATAAHDPKRKHHFPLTLAAAKQHAESENSYHKRKLSWALKEYKSLHVPISTNILRRIAWLPPKKLMEHRDFIVEEAKRLKISIDARCFLSPLGYSPAL